ncbi:Receptor expression-enhancing 2 [Hyphodiscus hymeniophilus]|uniref:Protein YOP1 n=1 Tax=Hyphodiscus hymeniophilus TaxID=353542 RepID=A0A9P6VKE8_9HELO|nr:Receptor expression-enhancing 2 [Hyphodiscus hymeniophilus]
MFDTFARLLSSVPTFLFPVFASYKALKTSDPALLTPWLMYWVVLACALLFESWVGFILYWIPFYAWFRLFFLLYLILPQTQGARVLYQQHVDPFLHDNELAIDDFISSAHDRAKAAGVEYLKQAYELIKQHLLGLPPKEPTPPSTPSNLSYTQSLIARFNLPSARPAFPANPVAGATADNFYSLLASAVGAATSSSPSAIPSQANRDLSNSGTLVPPTFQGEDRLTFISAQRERLSILLSALDKEARNLQGTTTKGPAPRNMSLLFDGNTSNSEEEVAERPKSGLSGLSTRKSEVDFEKIDAESGSEEVENGRRQTVKRGQSASGSWLPWSWGAKAENSDAIVDTIMAGVEEDKAKSSAVDA